jgi:hypothetical protein
VWIAETSTAAAWPSWTEIRDGVLHTVNPVEAAKRAVTFAEAVASGDPHKVQSALGAIVLNSPSCLGCTQLAQAATHLSTDQINTLAGEGTLTFLTTGDPVLVIVDTTAGVAAEMHMSKTEAAALPSSGQSNNAPRSPLSYNANPDCVIEYKDQVWAGWKDSPVLSDLSGKNFTFPRVNLSPGDLIHLHARQCSEMDNPSTGVHAVADAVLSYQTDNIVPVEKASTIVYFLVGHPSGVIDGGPGHGETASILLRDDFRRKYSLGYKPYTWHVIVASFPSEPAAKAKVVELNNKYPNLYFQETQSNVPPKGPIWMVTLGSGVGQAAAEYLLQIAKRDLGMSDANKFCWWVGRSDPYGQCAK